MKPFTAIFPLKGIKKQKDRTINRHSAAVRERVSEPEEILKIIWHVQAAHKQHAHCLLLLSSAED